MSIQVVGFDKNIARDAILFHVLQFCVGTTFSDGKTHCFGKSFHNVDFQSKAQVQPGDLVRLRSIRLHQWSLCWLHEIRNDGQEFLCENIETGEMCWWSNVGVEYLDRETVEAHPEWRWTDRQHEFNQRWNRVCYKDHDAYITLPVRAKFGGGFEVTLGTRTRFGFDDYLPSKTFADWRKVTKAMMGEFYEKCVAERPVKETQ